MRSVCFSGRLIIIQIKVSRSILCGRSSSTSYLRCLACILDTCLDKEQRISNEGDLCSTKVKFPGIRYKAWLDGMVRRVSASCLGWRLFGAQGVWSWFGCLEYISPIFDRIGMEILEQGKASRFPAVLTRGSVQASRSGHSLCFTKLLSRLA